MLTEKMDMDSIINYVMKKHNPQEVITVVNLAEIKQDRSTHIIYEISGNDYVRILTRVGEACPGEMAGDFSINIYPHFSVSGELVLVKIASDKPTLDLHSQ